MSTPCTVRSGVILTLAALTVPLAAESASAAITPQSFNFNTTGQLANFTASTGTTTSFTESTTGGVGNSGRVVVSTDAGGVNYNLTTGGTQDAGETVNVSAFFQTNASTGTAANQVAAVGLSGGTGGEFGTGSTPSLSVSLRYPGSGTAGTVSLATANNSGTNTNTLQGSTFTAASNTWYRLVAEITKSSTASTYTVSGWIEDWGANGTALTTPLSPRVAEFSGVSLTNAALYGDTDGVHAGFFARQTSGNPIQMQSVDNFAVVPEPASLGLLALGGLALARRRRV